jgi:hypothetical protein
MIAPTYRQMAQAVLEAHKRESEWDCRCGAVMMGVEWESHVAEVLSTHIASSQKVRDYVFCETAGAPRPVEHGRNQWAGAYEHACGPHHEMMIGYAITEPESTRYE